MKARGPQGLEEGKGDSPLKPKTLVNKTPKPTCFDNLKSHMYLSATTAASSRGPAGSPQPFPQSKDEV